MQDKEVSEQKLEGKEVPSIDINDILEELPEEKRKVIVAIFQRSTAISRGFQGIRANHERCDWAYHDHDGAADEPSHRNGKDYREEEVLSKHDGADSRNSPYSFLWIHRLRPCDARP